MDQAGRPGTVPVEGLTFDGTSVPPKQDANAVGSNLNSDKVGHGLPRSVRRPLASLRVLARRPTARARTTPDFLIVGAQRSGTTSLYRYLAEHPADLVLLDANPLTDISNVRRINAVMLGGRLFRRADLDKLLSQARAAAAQ